MSPAGAVKKASGPYRVKSMLPKIATYAILIFFVFVAILPLYWMWQASLRPHDSSVISPFAIPKRLTAENLVEAWTTGKMSLYMVNSILVAVPRVVCVLLLASLAGFSFGKLKWKGRDLVFGFILLGMMVPIQAMLIPLYYNIQGYGLINTRWSLVLPYLGLSMPFACFMMRAFYRDLPGEIMESATIDGCGKLRTWASIMAPLTKPALVSLLIFEFMWSWNDYLLPILMVYTDSARTMPLGLNAFRGKYASRQVLLAAGATITTVPILVVYAIFQRSFVQGITAGAVKG